VQTAELTLDTSKWGAKLTVDL